MAWPEKEKNPYFCVMFNQYGAVDHLTIDRKRLRYIRVTP